MDKYFDHSQNYLGEKAAERGVNAVLGVCFDLRDATKLVLMGTAVILEDE
ncbi:MAG: hypothetical protein RR512_07925 [Coprobacillus sp.]